MWNFSMKKVAGLILAAVILIGVTAPVASAADFSTNEYKVNVDIKKDKSMYITENINIDVLGPIHGIYRYIPLNKKMTYNNELGEPIVVEKAFTKVSDISVAKDPFEAYNEKGNAVIKIGDPNKYVTEKNKNYTLSYKVQLYNDKVKEYDAFIYNVLPADWETPISKGIISVTFPENIDKETIHVYTGKYGKNNASDKVNWKLEGNTITIETKEALEQGEGITLGVKLKEGYFKGAPSMTWHLRLLGIASLLIGAIVILLWFKYGRDPKSVHTVEFYPPEGMSPAEVGYIIDGNVEARDIVSLIFYFAEKGFLTIESKDNQNFTLHKVNDLPEDAKQYEKVFFKALFENGNSTDLKDLSEDFHEAYAVTVDLLKGRFAESREEKIFSPKAIKSRAMAFSVTLAGLIGGGLLMTWLLKDWMPFIGMVIITILLSTSYVLSMIAFDSRHSKNKISKVANSALALIIFVVAAVGTMFFVEWMTGSILVGICYIIMEVAGFIAIRYMQARTKYGAEILGKILGFKEFIKVAEAEKLKMLVEESPEYFYNVLPYAYVMGISKKWAKKFEEINVEKPNWYSADFSGGNMFNALIFYNVFRGCMHSTSSHINIPSSNVGGQSGTFGGGGGFSGGGFGGGGGGSW